MSGSKRKNPVVRAAALAARGAAAVGTALGAGAALNAYLGRPRPLPPYLAGRDCRYDWRLGEIAYTVAGEGPPVLLVHGIGVGASSYEWRRNFEALATRFEVYALDLAGFGRSERPTLQHSGRYFVQLIDDFIRYVIKRQANVIASSHSAAYAFRLAYTRPERIRSIAAICPLGMGSDDRPPLVHRTGETMALPLIGETSYYALTSRANIARTLREEIYYDAGLVTETMIDHYYAAAHQPNSRLPISALLRGELELNIATEFRSLQQPVIILWGAESRYTPVTHARRFQEARGDVILQIFQEARQLPHDEQAEKFNRLIISWLEPITTDQEIRLLG